MAEEDSETTSSGAREADSAQVGVRESGRRREPLLVVPLLLGFFIVALDVFIFVRQRPVFVAKNLQGSAAFALLITSLFIGLFLVVYAVAMHRSDSTSLTESGVENRQGSRYIRWVVVPLLLAVAAPLATIGALQIYPTLGNSQVESQKPCIDLYQQAASLRKEIPSFEMPSDDRDQRRCKINEALR